MNFKERLGGSRLVDYVILGMIAGTIAYFTIGYIDLWASINILGYELNNLKAP